MWPGCMNARRQAQAAKYCAEHATSIDYHPQSRLPTLHEMCEICGNRYGLVKRYYHVTHKLCPSCKALWSRRFKLWRMHGASPELCMQWAHDPRCWVCDKPIVIDMHGNNRNNVHVDHDHRCHPGGYGCGRCIRGLAHADCNLKIGALESLLARMSDAQFDGVLLRLRLHL